MNLWIINREVEEKDRAEMGEVNPVMQNTVRVASYCEVACRNNIKTLGQRIIHKSYLPTYAVSL